MRDLRAIASVIVMGLVATSTSARAEAMVVLQARGIALAPGTVLDSEARLVLKRGQHLTLISLSGETIRLQGPHNGRVLRRRDRADPRITVLAALLTERGQRTSDVGAARLSTVHKPLPEPWLIDVTHNGSVCLQEGSSPVFWRPDPKNDASVTVVPGDRSWRVETPWPSGSERLAVGVDASVHSGATYYVTFDGIESMINVVDVPLSLPNDAVRAAWMANNGCEAQANALARGLK